MSFGCLWAVCLVLVVSKGRFTVRTKGQEAGEGVLVAERSNRIQGEGGRGAASEFEVQARGLGRSQHSLEQNVDSALKPSLVTKP